MVVLPFFKRCGIASFGNSVNQQLISIPLNLRDDDLSRPRRWGLFCTIDGNTSAAAYKTPLTTLRGAGRMPDSEDDTSGSDDDGDGSPSVRGQGPLRGRGRGRGRGGGRSRRERGAACAPGGATGRAHGADGADGSPAPAVAGHAFRTLYFLVFISQ